DRLNGRWAGRRDRAAQAGGDEDRRHRGVRAKRADRAVGRANRRSSERVDADLERGPLHRVRRGRREHRVAATVTDAVADDVPARAGLLTEDEIDVATTGNRAKLLKNDLRVGLQDHERSVEECERGVRT